MDLKAFGLRDQANLQRRGHMPVFLKDNYSIRSACWFFVCQLHLHLSQTLIGHYAQKGYRFNGFEHGLKVAHDWLVPHGTIATVWTFTMCVLCMKYYFKKRKSIAKTQACLFQTDGSTVKISFAVLWHWYQVKLFHSLRLKRLPGTVCLPTLTGYREASVKIYSVKHFYKKPGHSGTEWTLLLLCGGQEIWSQKALTHHLSDRDVGLPLKWCTQDGWSHFSKDMLHYWWCVC